MRKYFAIINVVITLIFLFSVLILILNINTLQLDSLMFLRENNVLMEVYIVAIAGIGIAVFGHLATNSSFSKEVIYVDKVTIHENKKDIITNEGINISAKIKETVSLVDEIISSEKDLESKLNKILSSICNNLQAGQGIIYKSIEENNKELLSEQCSYAVIKSKEQKLTFEYGEGLIGFSAKENKVLIIDEVPSDYLKILSGLGKSLPKSLLILPLVAENKVTGILELSLFHDLSQNHTEAFSILSQKIGSLLKQTLNN